MRYFSLVKTLSRDSLIRLCHLDYDREMALTAVTADGGTMLGVSRYYLRPETGEAEFALVVNDAFQRQRLGRHLLERLIAVARERGVKKLTGLILAENAPMLALATALGFLAAGPAEDGVVQVDLALQDAADASSLSIAESAAGR
jgi:acetyltransferase